ncbi:asparagine synthase-related protein [Sphingobacterium thalpophilum]|uniref:asparagine synthase-related protein n=1 Tax=Sphingobacterium thalpophilum TaxID=259 RepID=UPI003C750EE3
MDKFKYYNYLGFHNPYYVLENNKFIINDNQGALLNSINKPILDSAALLQVLSNGFPFGDRTLIKQIKKTPWMAKPNGDYSEWQFFDVPKHNELIFDEIEISNKFYSLLEAELLSYIACHEHIGILLTGGMDSRIVAAVLNNVIKEQKVTGKSVTAMTWGKESSRDVIYAKRISKLFGWEWKHLVVDVDQMKENIDLSIESGCEFTPIHLHAMAQVTKGIELNCVIAGSFGDSIGRGEYSGTKVKDLRPLHESLSNFGGLLKKGLFVSVEKDAQVDIDFYHSKFPEQKLYQQVEQDLQLHYMRRMLNSCMNVINKRIPLYQMFSSPEVFGYIWSLSPDVRTDLIYKRILENFCPQLLEVPWARTGLPYPEKIGTPDQFEKQHHNYGDMIRTYFLPSIEENIRTNRDIVEKLFNFGGLLCLIKNCKNYPIKGSYIYEEKLLYISTVIKFIEMYNLSIVDVGRDSNWKDTLKNDLLYKLKYIYKKYR